MAQTRPPLTMVTWRCTRACVGSCVYCSYTKEYAKDSELDTGTAKKVVDEIHDFGAKWFGISGGEPLVRPDIFEVIAHAKNTYGMEVSLITSGFAFDQKRLDNLAKYDVHTAVSIDGDKEANDIIRGKGSYDKAIFAMKKLSEKGLLDCIVTTMTKYNLKGAGAHVPTGIRVWSQDGSLPQHRTRRQSRLKHARFSTNSRRIRMGIKPAL